MALAARNVTFTLHPGPESRITLRTLDGQLERDLAVSVLVDGMPHALDVDKAATPGGFWTPATIFGDRLIQRLTAHSGLTFEVVPDSQD